MDCKIILARYWKHDTRYVGCQPPPLQQQIEKEMNEFLNSIGPVKILNLQQSLARDDGTETALITIFYKQK